jgi:predicted DCC family thiol-disulfide oxidoreductase YuxK
MEASQKGKIFFDGLCVACSLEIQHYQKLDQGKAFDYIDITHPLFKAEEFGLDPFLVHKRMHVQDSQGIMHEGVSAFVAIWKKIPRYGFLARLAERRLVRGILQVGYNGFVVVRPYLPRRKQVDCSASPYCELKHS